MGESTTASGDVRAFLWQHGVMRALPSSGYSYAMAVNNRGQIVGQDFLPDTQAPHAVLWQHNAVTDLGTLGGPYSSATAINNRGQVVGASGTPTGETLPLVGQYYRQAQELAYPSTHTIATVLDVNGDGTQEIVVHSTFWEGTATTIYAVHDSMVQHVGSVGCHE